MRPFVRHVGIPTLAPLALYALYLTPVTVFGCLNRGLMAVVVVLLSSFGAIATIGLATRERLRGRPATWWLLSTLILVLPLVMIVSLG